MNTGATAAMVAVNAAVIASRNANRGGEIPFESLPMWAQYLVGGVAVFCVIALFILIILAIVELIRLIFDW